MASKRTSDSIPSSPPACLGLFRGRVNWFLIPHTGDELFDAIKSDLYCQYLSQGRYLLTFDLAAEYRKE